MKQALLMTGALAVVLAGCSEAKQAEKPAP